MDQTPPLGRHFPRRPTPVSTQAPPPNVTVQVHQAEATPFGLESQLAEVRRRLDELERELSSLKARQAASETRDSNFEAKLAELVVAKEALERSAKDIERSLKAFEASVEAQSDETRALVRDVLKAVSWRSVVVVVAAFFGGAALKLLEQVVPQLKP